MAKDPAFLFYPNDWLGGTIGMTFEEKGAYMELLMMQFNRGHMTSHMCGQVVGQIWDNIKDKFVQDEKVLWYNKRLEEEQENRKNFTNSRKNNLSGTNQYTKKDKKTGHKNGHMTSHMEDEDEDVNEVIDNNIKRAFDEIYIGNTRGSWRHIDFEFELRSFIEKVRGSPGKYKDHNHEALRLALQSQLRTSKSKPPKGNELVI
jgi:uncharacterized protein YdaU (DUF1376 family)